MSHDITIRTDGTAEAMYALQPAWHGLGTVVEQAPTGEDALKMAQLDWEVEQYPLYAEREQQLVDTDGQISVERTRIAVPGYANVRQDTGLVLGTVSENYRVVQNVEAFAFLDALIQDEVLRYESAFSLGGGKKVILLARLPEVDQIVEGDGPTKRYILLSTSHDGSEAIRFGATAVRVVCANTYALAKQRGSIESIRHTGDINEKLEQARQIIGLADGSFRRHSEACRALARRHMAASEFRQFLDEVVPPLWLGDPAYTPQRAKVNESIRTDLIGLYRDDYRQQLPGVARTAYAAWNAITQYVDHMPRRGASDRRREEARFNVTQYGTGNAIKQRAFAAACKIAGVESE